MKKNILTYEFILLALFMLPSTTFANDVSKNQPTKERFPVELQREQSQQLAPKKMGRVKLADETSGYLKNAQFIQTEIRGV